MLYSLYANLYTALQKRIKEQVKEIAWIDLDLGQLEIADEIERKRVKFPCVLIDFPTASYKDESKGVQWVDINISVRLATAPFSSTSGATPTQVQEKGLSYFELENKLYVVLQGFDCDENVQGLSRVSVATEQREDTIRVREMMFTTATEDESAQDYENVIAAPLQIDNELE